MSGSNSQASVAESCEKLRDLTAARLVKAQAHDWGVPVDAYLIDAADFESRLVAYVYADLSGRLDDGMTIVTPPVELISQYKGMALFRTMCGKDNYVLVSRLLGAASLSSAR
ncbi:hypothetical protein [Pseudomonas qingdaonensis]|uniref:hypothetical protein n=1 Tax=Pseudomonas qingdaonensis TaxID=2056231 RepID=UPI0028AED202|nr:hypothetical protein [Pseudomonas qingdaonensis]